MDTEKNAADSYREEGRVLAPEVGLEEPADSFLFNTRLSVWRYVVRMWLIAFVPSIILAIGLSAMGIITEESSPDLGGNLHPGVMLVAIVVLSPVVETLLMGVVLRLLSLVTKRRYALATISCVFWAVVHSLASPPWGLTIIWPFFIFSCSYLAWRRRSWWHAVSVTCAIHLLQNLPPGILLFVVEIQKKGW